jgi:hypothetical protein
VHDELTSSPPAGVGARAFSTSAGTVALPSDSASTAGLFRLPVLLFFALIYCFASHFLVTLASGLPSSSLPASLPSAISPFSSPFPAVATSASALLSACLFAVFALSLPCLLYLFCIFLPFLFQHFLPLLRLSWHYLGLSQAQRLHRAFQLTRLIYTFIHSFILSLFSLSFFALVIDSRRSFRIDAVLCKCSVVFLVPCWLLFFVAITFSWCAMLLFVSYFLFSTR